jgi:hypothetical protein
MDLQWTDGKKIVNMNLQWTDEKRIVNMNLQCMASTDAGQFHYDINDQQKQPKMTSRKQSNNSSGELLLPDEKSSFCIGCAL